MIKKALSFFVACAFGIGVVHGAQQQTFEQRFQERFLPAQVEWCRDINHGPIEGESFATTFHRMTGNELTVEYLKEHGEDAIWDVCVQLNRNDQNVGNQDSRAARFMYEMSMRFMEMDDQIRKDIREGR